MFKEIIDTEKLNCTEEEFENFYNSIDLTDLEKELNGLYPTKHTFDELYNGIKVDNPANGQYYYTLEVGGRAFLQNIVPYIQGLNPINDDNIDEVINNHKTQLIKDYLNGERFGLTMNYFKSK